MGILAVVSRNLPGSRPRKQICYVGRPNRSPNFDGIWYTEFMNSSKNQPLPKERLAKRYVWWQDPRETLQDIPYLLCKIMHLGTVEDYLAAIEYFGKDSFIRALVNALPGAMDERSWNFWHLHYHLPLKPFPKRSFL